MSYSFLPKTDPIQRLWRDLSPASVSTSLPTSDTHPLYADSILEGARKALTNDAGMDPTNFSCIWSTLHRFAATEDPFCLELLTYLTLYLPCSLCRSHLECHLSNGEWDTIYQHNLDPRTGKLNLSNCFCQLHNAVNASTHKKELSDKQLQSIQHFYRATIHRPPDSPFVYLPVSDNEETKQAAEHKLITACHDLEWDFWLALALLIFNFPVDPHPKIVPRHQLLLDSWKPFIRMWFSWAVHSFRYTSSLSLDILNHLDLPDAAPLNRYSLIRWFVGLVSRFYPVMFQRFADSSTWPKAITLSLAMKTSTEHPEENMRKHLFLLYEIERRYRYKSKQHQTPSAPPSESEKKTY